MWKWLTIGGLLTGCALLPSLDGETGPWEAKASRSTDDAVVRAIFAGGEQPADIFEIRQKLHNLGGRIETHIVANRGHDNPEAGSFSFFETYTGPMEGGVVREGELFLGFFSERQGTKLAVQQSVEPGLMVELIAWDYTKNLYNFWELVGNGQQSEWHLRGDSNDILADVARIQTGQPNPTFGNRLRCSGCHTLGGPIMKELEGPHNDWWTPQNRLNLGTLQLLPGPNPKDPVQVAGRLFQRAQDASRLSRQVKLGMQRLIDQRRHTNLKASLRSLFATMEMNLASDRVPFQNGSSIALPASFFVDSRLSGDAPPLPVPHSLYMAGLQLVGSRFAPDEAPGLVETRHAFLVPVRSHVDNLVIDSLINQGLVDRELVSDVLAVDFTQPVYSAKRAGLIRFVPETAADAEDLKNRLIANLMTAPRDPAAQELLANLTDASRNEAFHQARARHFLETCARNKAVPDWLKLASQRRQEVAHAETSRNPRGQILEPGFRVIFPVDRLQSRPQALSLDPETCRCQ